MRIIIFSHKICFFCSFFEKPPKALIQFRRRSSGHFQGSLMEKIEKTGIPVYIKRISVICYKGDGKRESDERVSGAGRPGDLYFRNEIDERRPASGRRRTDAFHPADVFRKPLRSGGDRSGGDRSDPVIRRKHRHGGWIRERGSSLSGSGDRTDPRVA